MRRIRSGHRPSQGFSFFAFKVQVDDFLSGGVTNPHPFVANSLSRSLFSWRSQYVTKTDTSKTAVYPSFLGFRVHWWRTMCRPSLYQINDDILICAGHGKRTRQWFGGTLVPVYRLVQQYDVTRCKSSVLHRFCALARTWCNLTFLPLRGTGDICPPTHPRRLTLRSPRSSAENVS